MIRWLALTLSILFAACGGAGELNQERGVSAIAGGERTDTEQKIGVKAGAKDDAKAQDEENSPSIAALFAKGELGALLRRAEELSPDELAPGERRLIGRALAYRGEYERSLALSEEAFEREQDYHALVDRGALLLELGRLDEARSSLRRVIAAYNRREIAGGDGEAIFAVARAARLLGSARDANRAFEEAARLKPNDAAIELAWSELLFEAHAHDQARQKVERLLRRAPGSAEAHAMLAEIYLAEAKPSRLAREEAERALECDPKNLRAQKILITLTINLRDEERALSQIERLEEQTHRSVLSLTLRGALAFLLDQHERFAAIEREVLEKNPRPARFYESIADLVELDHRYEEAAALSASAVAAIPEDARSLARLGMNLLRIGKEREGRAKLREAVKRDPFNRRAHHVLDLYERRIDPSYTFLERPPFRLRVHQREAVIIERFVLPYLMSALRTLEARYGYKPEEPIQIEFYRDPKDASIRAAGVPDLPFQAICFGRVITAVSPSVGGFNWGQILWHELAHVFHLQMSRGRAPRWLMEGLAERETMISPRAYQRPLAQRIHSFLAARAIPPLSEFDALFAEARVMDELIVSYGLSTLAVNFLEETFGIKRLAAMLRGFGEGRRFAELAQSELGLSAAALDARFEAHLEAIYRDRAVRYEPDFEWYPSLEEFTEAAPAQQKRAVQERDEPAILAAILFRDGRRVEAAARARQALEKNPDALDALFVQAKLSQRREQAAALFEALLERRESVGVRLDLARLYAETNELERARAQLVRALELDPERAETRLRMAQIASARGDHAAEVEALEELMALEPHAAGVALRLLRELANQKDYRRLLVAAEEARFTSLFDPRIHLYRLIAAARLREYELAREALADLEAIPGPLDGLLFRQAIEALTAAGYGAERSALERLFMLPRRR